VLYQLHIPVFFSNFIEKYQRNMTGHFQVRTYGKGELAMLYAPHVSQAAACKRLMYWISLQPQLVDALKRYGLTPTSRTFTPIQVRLIVDALGEP
jgi:hypothetical protein